MKQRYVVIPLLLSLLMGNVAYAHQIWLEQTPKAASLYFGEYDRNLREISPGALDKIAAPTIMLSRDKGEQALTFSKTDHALLLSAHADKGDTIYAEERTFPISEYTKDDKLVRFGRILGARLVTSDAVQVPKLTLDLVPTGKKGEFKVYYKNQPQAKTKVGAIAQSGWTRDVVTDEHGVVRFDLSWQGTYVLEVRYVDKTAGERDGKPYDFTNYMTTLSLTNDVGLGALPVMPAATPH